MYNSSYLTALFVGCMLSGKPIPRYEEIFKQEEKVQYIDNAVLKDMWLDYMEAWNRQRGERNAKRDR